MLRASEDESLGALVGACVGPALGAALRHSLIWLDQAQPHAADDWCLWYVWHTKQNPRRGVWPLPEMFTVSAAAEKLPAREHAHPTLYFASADELPSVPAGFPVDKVQPPPGFLRLGAASSRG